MALLKLLYPGMRIKRWFFLFAGGVVAAGFGVALLLNYRFIGLVEGWLFWAIYRATGNYYGWMPTLVGAVVVHLTGIDVCGCGTGIGRSSGAGDQVVGVLVIPVYANCQLFPEESHIQTEVKLY